MIDSYLKELVQSNRRVIIPDFGAFLKKDKSAATSEDVVIFSPFLRFNDGLLEGYLVEKKRITKEEASATVRRYVQDVKQTIAGQRPYYVEDLGVFYEDERGSVQFLYAETEKEALSRFEKAIAAVRVNTPTFMPELEVKTPAAVEELVEPVVEEKKKTTRKKVVEVVVPEEEEDDVIEAEEVKTVSVRGRKKADVKDVNKKEAKDNKAVAKTIINVNVTTEKSKEEQLEAADKSLQRWIAEVEKRKEEQAQDDKKTLMPQSTREGAEAQRRRKEELERALEKKRHDDEEAREREREAALSAKAVEEEWKAKRQSPPAVWEEEVIERKRGGRGAVLLLVVMLIVLSLVGALWFWTPLSEALGWDIEDDPTEVVMESYYAEPPKPPYAPPVSAKQPGMYYVAVGSFSQQQIKEVMAICQTLYDAGFTPEVVRMGNKFSISAGKYRSANEAKAALGRYSQKFGKRYGEASIVP